jgi:hypothetical protein
VKPAITAFHFFDDLVDPKLNGLILLETRSAAINLMLVGVNLDADGTDRQKALLALAKVSDHLLRMIGAE